MNQKENNTLNSVYNEVTFNEKSATTKENLCTRYFPFTYKYVALNEKLPIMKENLCIFFLVIGRVECTRKNILDIVKIIHMHIHSTQMNALEQTESFKTNIWGGTGGSCLSHTVVKPGSHLALIFCPNHFFLVLFNVMQ